MVDHSLYPMIYKRKSVRRFDSSLTLSAEELVEVRAQVGRLTPLLPEVKTAIEIVPRAETSAMFGQWCAVCYAEPTPQAWLNCGYLLEQLDLWLAARDIGACWYGFAKPRYKVTADGLQYIILLAFGKSKPGDFRQQDSDIKRKKVDEIWQGVFDPRVREAVRYAPSATNSQPWRVVSQDDGLAVYRATRYLTYMPPRSRDFFNTIDMGIFLLTLELALDEYGFRSTRILAQPGGKPVKGLVHVGRYEIT